MPRFNSDLLPDATGRDLGSPSEQFDAHIQDLTVYRNLNLNGGASFHGNSDTATLAATASKLSNPDKGFVNAITDGGCVGDGVTDDYAALQALLTANPGKVILLPKRTAATVGGGGASNFDYYCSQRLDFPAGNGTVLRGVTPARWSGSVCIKFAAGVGGIRIPFNAYGCGLEDIELRGGYTYDRTSQTTWVDYSSAASLIGDGQDGVQFLGGEPWMKNVTASQFKRHGFNVDGTGYTGQLPAQPDIFNFVGGYASNNGGYGLAIHGTDANVGVVTGFNAIGNALGGTWGSANYGATFNVLHTSLNANDSIVAGANKTIAAASGIVVASGIATITTTASHGWSAGTWITSTGSTDTAFNETAKILTVPTTTTATYATAHADGNTSNGTVATSSSTQIYTYYTSKSVVTGAIVEASSGVYIQPYKEGNQTAAQFGTGSLIFGGASLLPGDRTAGTFMRAGLLVNAQNLIYTPLTSGGLFVVRNVADNVNEFTVSPAGDIVSLGTSFSFGANPATSGSWKVPNAFTMYARNFANSANHRIMLFHTDNTLYLGESTGSTTGQGAWSMANTFGVTGVSTLTGGAKVGSGGTTLTQAKVYSQTITAAATAAASAVEQTFTVAGLTTSDKVFINPPAISNSCVPVACRVTAVDTLGITFLNPTAGSLTSTSGTYLITAIRS